jgi:A/G-specific adenine glycosylase
MGNSKSALRLSPASLPELRLTLLSWYARNKRDLPWRRDADPYRVWVSEIMLQQTRVAAVLGHYKRFMRRFPKVQRLAAARESSALAAWSGLGYYHRARRMHQAARAIVRKLHGKFPGNEEEWRKLPGIGRYTAAAIASIAFGEAVAAVDGNVERVLTRVFGHAEGREATWRRAEMLLDRERPGDFNQTMMELGATVCTPRAPQCLLCPLNRWCKSRGADAVRPQTARKHKQLCYALVQKGKNVLLAQRPANTSLMAAMWELPSVPESGRDGNEPVARLRHSITDTDYEVLVFSVAPDGLQSPKGNTRWFSRKQWERLPLTGLTRKVLHRLLVESGDKAAESNQRS